MSLGSDFLIWLFCCGLVGFWLVFSGWFAVCFWFGFWCGVVVNCW